MIVDILIVLGYFLDINDVRNLGMVSKYFQQTIANMYQHSFKIFNCNSINPATENEWRFVLKKIGPHITSIKFDGQNLDQDLKIQLLSLIFDSCKFLNSICIKNDDCNDDFIKINLSKLEETEKKTEKKEITLKKINWQRNKWINGDCFTQINNLDSLTVSYCINMQPTNFIMFIQNNTNLIKLNIAGCYNLNRQALSAIIRYLQKLEDLTVNNIINDSLDLNSATDLSNLPNLKKLHVKFINNTDVNRLLASLAEANLLEFLDISGGLISNKFIYTIADFNYLKTLRIKLPDFHKSYCEDIHGIRLKSFANKVNPTKIFFINFFDRVEKEDIIWFVADATKLCILDIRNCYVLDNDFYYRVSAIIKEQNRNLTVFVTGTTEINQNDISPEIMAENRRWIQWNFSINNNDESNEGSDIDYINEEEVEEEDGELSY